MRVESISGSYAGRMAPPGMPKMSVAPALSRDLIRLCAPVMPRPTSASRSSGLPDARLTHGASFVVIVIPANKKPLGPVGNEG